MDIEVDSTIDKGGAPEGNQNAKKGKLFYDQLRMVLIQNDKFKLRKIADKLVESAEKGESWAIKEIMDSMDGKAVQATEISGPDGSDLVKGIAITFVEPDGNKEGQ